MSLWFPVMVNSTKVGLVSIVRQQGLTSPRDAHEYTWELTYNPIGQDGYPSAELITKGGTVTHRYDEGWPALLGAVMNEFQWSGT